jgi:hypothetical protein
MKWLQNKWTIALLFISLACIIANAIVLYHYHSVFNGSISQELNDWNLFIVIFNGIITTVLAVVNICAIIKINSTLDSNSENRHINNLIFEAQTILAKMRLDDYNVVKELINDIKVSIFKRHMSAEKVDSLKKKLMEMDSSSFLYRNQNLHEEPFMRPITKRLVVQIDNFIHKIKESKVIDEKDEEELLHSLSSFLSIMEFYVVSQLVRGSKVQRYISEHQDETDSTISCIYDFAKEINDKMEDKN